MEVTRCDEDGTLAPTQWKYFKEVLTRFDPDGTFCIVLIKAARFRSGN